jgi:predicted nucleic acid-binding protein
MSRIYWDTMLFVYWIEDHPRYAKLVRQLLLKMEKRQDQLCTSTFAVGEALVGPSKAGNGEAATKMLLNVFRSPFVEVIPFGLEAAEHYASIRANQPLSPPDAIHLACAAQARIDLFLTNNNDLIGKVIPGIQFIAGLDSNIL